jgi:hypothetical protein
MRAVAEPVEKGQSRVLLDAAFPLAEASEAHVRGETDRATGKSAYTVRWVPVAIRLVRGAPEPGPARDGLAASPSVGRRSAVGGRRSADGRSAVSS